VFRSANATKSRCTRNTGTDGSPDRRPALKKLVLIILDGVGCGELPDAHQYGDAGSNTLANTARVVGGFHLPNMQAMGLGNITPIEGVDPAPRPTASYGRMAERSRGKDSTTGHWELGGVITASMLPTYPEGFPAEVMDRFLGVTGVGGYLGNIPASGTAIIASYGDAHCATGYPIVYTSADSVFQIAAHEEVIPPAALYELCEKTRARVCTGQHAVGRVIARPFVGKDGGYTRTTNRRDFSLPPPAPTVLDALLAAGVPTTAIGKVDDLFAMRGISVSFHSRTNAEGVEFLLRESGRRMPGLIFANLVDFDMLYGHRNDPQGMARALEEFDRAVPALLATLGDDDLLIVTADHGNDPVMPSTDHSREYVPLLAYTPLSGGGVDLGIRSTFADVSATIAEYFGVSATPAGESFLSALGIERIESNAGNRAP
jgi:phosphopentomutase